MGLYFTILTVISLIVIGLAIFTPLLKDAVTDTAALTARAVAQGIKPNAPFSLAKSQLAFWTVIVLSSFVYLLFKYHFQVPDLSQVNLILLGISVGTTATAKLIDDSQKQNGDLSQDYPSEGFLKDILSDKSGVSIHRLQNVLWTFIVGIIYIHFVATAGSLPDETVLTENLLILMGISTGTYVGVKTMENSKKGN